MNTIYVKFVTMFITMAVFFCNIFNMPIPTNPAKKVDMSKFEMTFSDEFDGELDRTVWSGHYTYGDVSSVRRGAYWNNNVPYTEDGNLVIPLYYSEEGMGGTGAGWYSGGIDTDSDAENGFSQKYGYFECRCILPEGSDCWGAFWMFNDSVYKENGDGKDGTEIDVFESENYGDKHSNSVGINLHYDGYGDAHQHDGVDVKVKGNPYKEYNTYGVEWNEEGYIFYINGQEAWRTDFGGVCDNPLYLILSIELGGADGVPSGRANESGEGTSMVVDYVRAYQYKDLV